MSPFAVEYLRQRGIRPINHLRLPLEVTEFDWHTSDVVIAVNEPEHRPLVARAWPGHVDRVRYWAVADIDELAPTPALHRLQRHVMSLIDELAEARDARAASERLAS